MNVLDKLLNTKGVALSYDELLKILEHLMNSQVKVLPSHIKAYLAGGGDIDEIYLSHKVTLLIHFTSRVPNLKIAMTLVRLGANIEKTSLGGHTALWHGLTCMYVENAEERQRVCKFLIKAGANINAMNGKGKTIVMKCIDHYKRIDSLRMLLNAGAHLRTQQITPHGDRVTILYYALNKHSYIETIKALVNAGANVNELCCGESPLMFNIRHGTHIEIVKTLICAGADVNYTGKDGKTILMCAFEGETTLPIIDSLINAGANVNAIDNQGQNVLKYMLRCKRETVSLTLLIEAKVDVNHVFVEGGKKETVLDQLRYANRHFYPSDNRGGKPHYVNTMELLLKANAKTYQQLYEEPKVINPYT